MFIYSDAKAIICQLEREVAQQHKTHRYAYYTHPCIVARHIGTVVLLIYDLIGASGKLMRR